MLGSKLRKIPGTFSVKVELTRLLMGAETAMGKPLFKASDGGRFDNLREGEDSTQCELRQGSGT